MPVNASLPFRARDSVCVGNVASGSAPNAASGGACAALNGCGPVDLTRFMVVANVNGAAVQWVAPSTSIGAAQARLHDSGFTDNNGQAAVFDSRGSPAAAVAVTECAFHGGGDGLVLRAVAADVQNSAFAHGLMLNRFLDPHTGVTASHSATVVVTNSSFVNMTGASSPAAVRADDGALNVSSSVFKHCSAGTQAPPPPPPSAAHARRTARSMRVAAPSANLERDAASLSCLRVHCRQVSTLTRSGVQLSAPTHRCQSLAAASTTATARTEVQLPPS